MTIRTEQPGDFASIRAVIEAAFERPVEADLVEALRQWPGYDPALFFVAVSEDRVVGHIAFSPIVIEWRTQVWPSVALAPVCVAPAYQNRGVGSGLVLHGLQQCKVQGHGAVIVVGEPAYYSRFGFQPASQFGIRAPFEVPDEAFMAIELRSDALHGISGTVRYPAPFDAL